MNRFFRFLSAALVTSSSAAAQTPLADGVYDRFSGDVELALSLGAELSGQSRGVLRGCAYYFSTAGLCASYADAWERGFGARYWNAAVELKPLFVPRWGLDREFRSRFWDLSLDSFALSFGMSHFFEQSPRETAFALDFGTGIGIPLLGKAAGPWLEGRAVFRFPDRGDAQTSVLVLLGWHFLVLSPVATED